MWSSTGLSSSSSGDRPITSRDAGFAKRMIPSRSMTIVESLDPSMRARKQSCSEERARSAASRPASARTRAARCRSAWTPKATSSASCRRKWSSSSPTGAASPEYMLMAPIVSPWRETGSAAADA